MLRRSLALVLAVVFAVAAHAKNPPVIIDWPETGAAVLRFTVFNFKQVGSFSGQTNYAVESTVENLGSKRISHATFNFYVFDKTKVRIGQGYLDLSNLAPKETIKLQVNVMTVGTPVTLTVSPMQLPPELEANAPPKTVSLTIYSVPSGAKLVVDGKETGVTPIAVPLTVGSHKLEFQKEGFNPGTFPLVITPDQISGGQVSYELGTSAHDTVELRDGTLLSGDVERMDATTVEVRIGGAIQTLERNKVKRILLVERESPRARQ